MTSRGPIFGKTAIVGLGQTAFYKRGGAQDPEFVLAVHAIVDACGDAGIDPRDVDGFVSYADDRNTSVRMAAALGVKELRWSTMQWGGGGGGGSGAIQQAAAAIACGFAETVVVYRALAQGQFGRFGQGPRLDTVAGDRALSAPYGLLSPAQSFAMKMNRFMYETGVSPDTQRAVALASYHHAQQNPKAVMHGRPLDAEAYDNSRWIVEPWRLFDCCLENDCAAAVVLTSASRARSLRHVPAYVLGAAQGGDHRAGAPAHNATDYGTSHFKTVARRLYESAGLQPADVDVVQSYENFTGGVVMSLIEHGLCSAEEANEVLTYENLIAPGGRLPLNTSGGNLAECYVHGLGLVSEAVRQLRGTSTSQVPGARVALVSSGPMVVPCSNVLLGTSEALA